MLARCARCGHLTRDLTTSPAHHRDLAYGGEPTLDRIRLSLTYRELIRGRAPRSVFEIGYGSGSMLRRFLDDGAQVAGVDPDQLLVDVDPVVAGRGRLTRGTIEDHQGGDRSERYELVYGIHVLEHVVDVGAALRGSVSLLAPGGQVAFLTPAGDSRGLDQHGSAWWMLEDPTHVRFFTADSLARAGRAAGLVDVQVRRLLWDSLSVDAASWARRLRPKARPSGVLGEPGVMGAALASLPAVMAARLLQPRYRPTLYLSGRRPSDRAA